MIRTITFDNQRRFDLTYSGLIVGHQILVKEGGYPFEKTRKHAKILRKFKRVSTEIKDSPTSRTLMEPFPQIVRLDEEEIQLLKTLYERVDWNATISDEVVDTLDFIMGAPQEEE